VTTLATARRTGAGTLLVLAGGCALLPLRLRLLAPPVPFRLAILVGLYGLVLCASLLVPAPAGPRRLHPAIALGIGLGALGLAAIAAGPSGPLPVAGTAVALGVVAAVAEEALFRRAGYAALERYGPTVAIVATAAAFAAVHVPLYGAAAFPVDLGAALLLGWQRHATGSWSTPAATHAAANLLAVLR
jgi:membrane protease YdiL (CAAX protease family)